MTPVKTTYPRGRLWLFMFTNHGYFNGRAGVWAGVCENADADRPEWGTPRYLGPGGMFNFMASNDEGETWTRRGGLRVPERDWDETVSIRG